jgi:hypothetical protein
MLLKGKKLQIEFEVYDRSGSLLYSNEVNGGEWKEAPGAVAAIQLERNRKLSTKERELYIDSWRRVFEYMQKRRAENKEIERVKALAERFIHELRQDK